ncbi:MAG: hypothetical protein V2A73_15605 [Pseudomonadota bacterium]
MAVLLFRRLQGSVAAADTIPADDRFIPASAKTRVFDLNAVFHINDWRAVAENRFESRIVSFALTATE